MPVSYAAPTPLYLYRFVLRFVLRDQNASGAQVHAGLYEERMLIEFACAEPLAYDMAEEEAWHLWVHVYRARYLRMLDARQQTLNSFYFGLPSADAQMPDASYGARHTPDATNALPSTDARRIFAVRPLSPAEHDALGREMQEARHV